MDVEVALAERTANERAHHPNPPTRPFPCVSPRPSAPRQPARRGGGWSDGPAHGAPPDW